MLLNVRCTASIRQLLLQIHIYSSPVSTVIYNGIYKWLFGKRRFESHVVTTNHHRQHHNWHQHQRQRHHHNHCQQRQHALLTWINASTIHSLEHREEIHLWWSSAASLFACNRWFVRSFIHSFVGVMLFEEKLSHKCCYVQSISWLMRCSNALVCVCFYLFIWKTGTSHRYSLALPPPHSQRRR